MNRSFVVWGDTGTGAAKYNKSSTGFQPGQVGRSSVEPRGYRKFRFSLEEVQRVEIFLRQRKNIKILVHTIK